jgi:hypothetical protein
MAKMDHSDAVRLGATEKYLLGELSPSLRADFEDHYFDCPVCAADLQAASLFSAGSRKIFREAPFAVAASAPGFVKKRWFVWFRPAIVVPAFAVLLLLLGYQSFITVPHWQKIAASATAPRLLQPFYLHAGTVRSGGPAFQVAAGQTFQVFLDLPSDPRFVSYLLRLENSAGFSRDLLTLPASESGKTVLVQMPSNLGAASYDLVVLGLPSLENRSSASEISRSSFLVENLARIEQH